MSIIEISFRVFCAILVGGIIGFERERINRPAGLRTHVLVCVGAAVISIIQAETIEVTRTMILADPILANAMKADIGRMGAQVVTGVGFLGAGTIVKEKGIIKGLTTAASIWAVACIGLAIGMGFYDVTLVAVIGVLITIVLMKRIEKKFITNTYPLTLKITYKANDKFIQKLNDYFYLKKIQVQGLEFVDIESKGSTSVEQLIVSLDVVKSMQATKVLQDIGAKLNVKKIIIAEGEG